jgi:hypothetical protein
VKSGPVGPPQTGQPGGGCPRCWRAASELNPAWPLRGCCLLAREAITFVAHHLLRVETAVPEEGVPLPDAAIGDVEGILPRLVTGDHEGAELGHVDCAMSDFGDRGAAASS